MDIRTILRKLVNKEISIEEAESKLKLLAIEELGKYVKFDIGREIRRGIPEIVLAEGKSSDILMNLINRIVNRSGRVIVSRATNEQLKIIKEIQNKNLEIKVNEEAHIAIVRRRDLEREKLHCKVGIITAGTYDVPVAEEAKEIVEELGCEVETLYDVGIAGLQRAIEAAKKLKEYDVDIAIVIAGREGALPSIIASLLDIPIIAVPTSSGYGAGSGGLAALLSMLQSCSLGMAVVNIDNGVGAALFATLICRRISQLREMKHCE